MVTAHCQGSKCPVPGQENSVILKWSRLMKTLSSHRILCTYVSRLPVKIYSDKQINFTSYGIYRLKLSPHAKFILYTALLTLCLMKLHEHQYTHFTTSTSEAQRDQVICPRSQHESFTGLAMRLKFPDSQFWQPDHDAFNCITANYSLYHQSQIQTL